MRIFKFLPLAFLFLVPFIPSVAISQDFDTSAVQAATNETPYSVVMQEIGKEKVTVKVENLKTNKAKEDTISLKSIKTINGLALYLAKITAAAEKAKATATVVTIKTAQTYKDGENAVNDLDLKPVKNSLTKFITAQNQLTGLEINGKVHNITPKISLGAPPAKIEIAQLGSWWIRRFVNTGGWTLSVVAGKDLVLAQGQQYPEKILLQDTVFKSLQETETKLNALVKLLQNNDSDMSSTVLTFLKEIKVFAMMGSLNNDYWTILLSNEKDTAKEKKYNEIIRRLDLINQFITNTQPLIK